MTVPSDPPDSDDLERLLLGASRRYTREQVADAVGISVEEARMYWRALGFPDVGDEALFTVWDMEALQAVLDLVRSDVLDQSTALQMVRALGRTTGRLAEWHVETLAELIEEAEQSDRGTGSRLTAAYQVAQKLLPDFERLLLYAWRRKLASAAHRLIAIGDLGSWPLLAAPASVGFADLVSFTRLARGLSVEALGDLVEKFEATSNDVVFGGGGRVVKSLGDEVFFVADDPLTAVRIGCRLVAEFGSDPNRPDIRVGIATGPVVARMGDVFGTPANLAARLTALADTNSVLVDATTAEQLADEPSVALRAVPPVAVHGFGAVSAYAASARRSARRQSPHFD